MPAARRQWREFVEQTIKVLAQARGVFGSEIALADAVGSRMGWCAKDGPLTPPAVRRKALAYFANPNITEAIREHFEVNAGFSAAEAAQIHVKWIRGEMEHNGEKLPPSFQALKGYEDGAFPKQVKKVDVEQRSLVARFEVRDHAPPIRARVIDVEAIESFPGNE
jgi:hypothetical protein